jgi:Fur family zinc uptake transcriptional regulator
MAQADGALEGVLDRLASQCAASGGQLTSLRRMVLGLLLRAGQPVKAYTLIEEAAGQGRRLPPSTIYRVLDFLQEHGLVHKVNSLNSYVACSESDGPQGHQPLLLVCPRCQRTAEVNDPDLSSMFFARLQALGHHVQGGSIEVHGQCQLCAGK